VLKLAALALRVSRLVMSGETASREEREAAKNDFPTGYDGSIEPEFEKPEGFRGRSLGTVRCEVRWPKGATFQRNATSRRAGA